MTEAEMIHFNSNEVDLGKLFGKLEPIFRAYTREHTRKPWDVARRLSVSTRVWIKLPRADSPLCATRSASTNPGAGSFQSADVRIGTLRRRECAVCRRRLRPNFSRIGTNTRSIVAALIAKSLARISGARARWPCRSIASISAGINAFSRFPQIRSDASQRSTSALCSASL